MRAVESVRVKTSVNRNVKGGGQGNSDLFPGLPSSRWFVLPHRQLQIRPGIFGIFFLRNFVLLITTDRNNEV